MLCGWGLKAARIHSTCGQVKLCGPLLTHAMLECLRTESLTIKVSWLGGVTVKVLDSGLKGLWVRFGIPSHSAFR